MNLRLLAKQSPTSFREIRKNIQRDNRAFGPALIEITGIRPESGHPNRPLRAWRSREFLVQLFDQEGHFRLTVSRTEVQPDGNWKAGISWDELQRLKGEAGFGDRWAVEVFPPDADVVNVANMRHLFLLPEPPAFGWVKRHADGKEPDAPRPTYPA